MKKNLFTYTFIILIIQALTMNFSYAQNLAWAQGIGSSERFEQGDQIFTDQSGNFYVVGLFRGTVDFDLGSGKTEITSQGNSEAFFAKYNAKQELQWVKTLKGDVSESISKIVIGQSGSLYMIGSFGGTVDFDPSTATQSLTSAGSDDIFVAKYNAQGEYQWAFDIGGSQGDFGDDIVIDSDENVYITGGFNGADVDFDPSTNTQNLSAVGTSASLYVAKYNKEGAYQWAFRVGAAGANFFSAGGIALNGTANELVVAGEFNGTADFDPGTSTTNLNATNGSAFIAKYNTSGAYVSAKNFGVDAEVRSLVLDNTGNIYVCGSYQGTDRDFDPGTGTSKLSSKGNADWFIAQYNNAVELQWVKGLGGTDGDFPESIALDAQNNAYVIGLFANELSFNDAANTKKIQSNGSADVLLVSYDNTGKFRWANHIGGTGFDAGNDVFIDSNNGGIYMTGYYTGTADFDWNTGTTNLTSQQEDIFFVLYGDTEINLTLNNRSLASGATLDFGSIAVGSNSADSTIAIENNGVLDLVLSGNAGSLITLSGTNAADFQLVQTNVVSPISAGGNVTFTISYAPKAEGTASATLTIASNDNDEASYTIQLTGNGTNNVTALDTKPPLLWKVGPNPANAMVRIILEAGNFKSFDYQIINQQGKVVLSKKGKQPPTKTIEIALDQLPSGTYTLIITADGQRVVKKIVKN